MGSLSTSSEYGEISIYLDGNAAVDGCVDLDADGEFKVWLGKPRAEYDHIEYEIVKIEKFNKGNQSDASSARLLRALGRKFKK